MAGPNLPTNIDSTYPGSTTDPSADIHQQHHDLLHRNANRFDLDIVPGDGQVLAYEAATGLYKPVTPSSGGGSVDLSNTPLFLSAAAGGTGAYTSRPATSRPIVWRGVNKPTTNGSTAGGGGMVLGLDEWEYWSSTTDGDIADGSVTTAKIADGAITTAKLAAGTGETVTVSTKTASYILVAVDSADIIEMNVATANTLTVPANVFVGGQYVSGRQYGAGLTTITPGAGMTLRARGGALISAGQYAEWTITFRSATEAVVSGDLVAPVAPSGTVATFPTDGAGVPTGWTQLVNLGSVAVTSGALTLTSATGAYAGGPGVLWSAMTSAADFSVIYDIGFSGLFEMYPVVGFRADTNNGTGQYPLNGLSIEFQPATTAFHWLASQTVAGTKTQLSSGDFTFSAGTRVNVRQVFSGTHWQMRMWNVGTTEPTTWALDITTATVTAAGKMWFALNNGSAGTAVTASIDNVTVS